MSWSSLASKVGQTHSPIQCSDDRHESLRAKAGEEERNLTLCIEVRQVSTRVKTSGARRVGAKLDPSATNESAGVSLQLRDRAHLSLRQPSHIRLRRQKSGSLMSLQPQPCAESEANELAPDL